MINDTLKKAGKYFALCLISIIILISVALRIYIWYDANSFFTDEGAILYNVINRNYSELFLPPDMAQCCPPLFLVIVKFISNHTYGINEHALTVIPLTFSVLSVFLFTVFLFKISKNYLTIIFAMCLLFMNEDILRYTQELKQYSGDVFFCILLLLLALLLKDTVKTKLHCFLLSLLAIIFVWFSYTSVYIITGILISYLINRISLKININFKKFLFFLIPFIINLIILYIINVHGILNNPVITTFWAESYPKTVFHWTVFFAFVCSFKPGVEILFMILFFIGAVYLFLKERYFFILLFSIILMSLTAGYIGLYPMSPDRVSLYLVPVFILIASKSFEFIDFSSAGRKFISVILICGFLFSLILLSPKHTFYRYFTSQHLFKSSTAKEYVTVLKNENIKPNEIVYVSEDSKYIFDLYLKAYNVDNVKYIIETRWEDTDVTLNEFPKDSIVYIFVSDFNCNPFAPETIRKWIDTNCDILKKTDTDIGQVIKCHKIK